jgi:DNA invertase Pin-like site-specific DNA recombinase
MGTALLTIMAAFAQLERATMIERTHAGLLAPPPTGARADVHVRSTTPMPLKPVSSGAARRRVAPEVLGGRGNHERGPDGTEEKN